MKLAAVLCLDGPMEWKQFVVDVDRGFFETQWFWFKLEYRIVPFSLASEGYGAELIE